MLVRCAFPSQPVTPVPFSTRTGPNKAVFPPWLPGWGARLRYQIDRDSPEYLNVYRQRTATERVNSHSIAHYNSLIYILINLHALQRIRQRKAARSRQMLTKERAGEPEKHA